MLNKPKLIRITTVPKSLGGLLKGQLKFMNTFYEVIAVSGESEILNKFSEEEGVRVIPVTMTRTISPIKDLVALFKLVRIFKKENPFIVHTHTPKAGFLGMFAAWLTNVPLRLHTVAGLPLLEEKGIKRKILNIIEKVTYKLATNIYPNSFGLYNIILQNNFTDKHKLKVLGNGSSNGIDTSFFDSSKVTDQCKSKLKKELGIASEDFVYIYIGRLVKAKGINELIEAFKILNKNYNNTKLILVGGFEHNLDPLKKETYNEIRENKSIIHVGYQSDVRPYLTISDVLTFPSYREGFPNVVMQAGAMGLPSIVTDINGCNEIIENGLNGFAIPVKNVKALYDKMEILYKDRELTKKMGAASREPICKRYERKFVWNEVFKEYKRLEETVIRKGIYLRFFKPILDFILALFFLVVTSPILTITAIILFIFNEGKIFFVQERPGKDGKIFKLYKFKTMNDKKDSSGKLLPDSKRLTVIGKILRKTSIDELPQLLNVIKGEMSLIGPRPLLVNYLPFYTEREKLRHKVRPGITGYAQINGRNNLEWDKRLEYDVMYALNCSFKLDLKILFKSIIKVIKKDDIVVALDPKINIPLNIYRRMNDRN